MQMPRSRLNFIFLCYKQKTIDMATRKEDITVRIVADYAKAEADMQRFIGGASKSFAAIPASVNAATQSVDKLTSQLARNDAAMQTLPSICRISLALLTA
jgi:hypothetical protein